MYSSPAYSNEDENEREPERGLIGKKTMMLFHEEPHSQHSGRLQRYRLLDSDDEVSERPSATAKRPVMATSVSACAIRETSVAPRENHIFDLTSNKLPMTLETKSGIDDKNTAASSLNSIPKISNKIDEKRASCNARNSLSPNFLASSNSISSSQVIL